MGRKRPHASRAVVSRAAAAPGAKIRKMERYEDTLEPGSVDEHMFKRDRIMFNPQDESDDDDINANEGEEVLGLRAASRKRKDEDAEVEEEDAYTSDKDEGHSIKQRKVQAKVDLSKKGRFGKPIESSEDEDASASGSDSDEEEGWGRQYYSRPSNRREKENVDGFDEKRDEERDLEEKEVKRLQWKAREVYSGAEDWGYDGEAVVEEPSSAEDIGEIPTPIPAPDSSDPVTLLRHMVSFEPLKLALARDYPLVVAKLKKTARGIYKMTKEEEGVGQLHKGLGWLHYQTLLTYATTLAFYLYLCALPVDERPNLSEHPIMTRLLHLKEGVASLEDLDFAAGSVSEVDPLADQRGKLGLEAVEDEDEEELAELMKAKRELLGKMLFANGSGLEDMSDDEGDIDGDEEMVYNEDEDMNDLWEKAGLEDGELEDLMADLDEDVIDTSPHEASDVKRLSKEKKKKKKTRNGIDHGPGSAQSIAPLTEPTFVPTQRSAIHKPVKMDMNGDDILGDLSSLNEADAVDKERRKKSLRFHTSKIASTSARRTAARAQRMGGDEDVPYRDRQAARDAALRKASKVDGLGEDLDGTEMTSMDKKRAREVRDEDIDEDAEGYYDLVKRKKVDKAVAKEMAHEGRQVAKFASFEDEGHKGGPRSLTRAIEKNRGLTPRRSKTGRNPRVKKRQAYEKAKQKVGSQRAVYKGGQASLGGTYQGEKSGISTAVKSRKFK